MSLKDQIMSDVKEAMKAREQDKLTTLRSIHAEIKNKEISIRPKELTEEDVLAVLKKIAKQRKDSIEQFEAAGRADLVEKEKQELKYVEVYLPEEMSKEQIQTFVKEAIAEVGAADIKQMGQVMKAVMVKTKGQADNKVVSELVRASLQS